MKTTELNYIQDTIDRVNIDLINAKFRKHLVYDPQYMANCFIADTLEEVKEQGQIASMDRKKLAVLAKARIKGYTLKIKPLYEDKPKLQQQIAEEIDQLLAELPQQHFVNTSGKVTQLLLRAKPVQKLVQIQKEDIEQVDFSGARMPIEILKEDCKIEDLTVFDMAVMQAIASFWESGKREFTSKMVYSFLCGKAPNNGVIAACWQEQIDSSLHRLMGHTVKMDVSALRLTKEYKKYHFTADIYHGNLIYLEGMSGTFSANNGYKLKDTVWAIAKEPIFLTFCKDIKHITTLKENSRLLPKGSRPSVWRIELRECLLWAANYILQSVAENYKGKKEICKNKITYETLFANTHTDINTKSQKQRARNFIKALLQDWQSKGYIAGWKVSKQGRTEDGIYILKC